MHVSFSPLLSLSSLLFEVIFYIEVLEAIKQNNTGFAANSHCFEMK